jgi:hypothetical protein
LTGLGALRVCRPCHTPTCSPAAIASPSSGSASLRTHLSRRCSSLRPRSSRSQQPPAPSSQTASRPQLLAARFHYPVGGGGAPATVAVLGTGLDSQRSGGGGAACSCSLHASRVVHSWSRLLARSPRPPCAVSPASLMRAGFPLDSGRAVEGEAEGASRRPPLLCPGPAPAMQMAWASTPHRRRATCS